MSVCTCVCEYVYERNRAFCKNVRDRENKSERERKERDEVGECYNSVKAMIYDREIPMLAACSLVSFFYYFLFTSLKFSLGDVNFNGVLALVSHDEQQSAQTKVLLDALHFLLWQNMNHEGIGPGERVPRACN